MKLSTAIRIGSLTSKQIKTKVSDGGNGRCAIGAALLAVNATPAMYKNWPISLWKSFPLSYNVVPHPQTGMLAHVSDIIWQLNDAWDWSREMIADWVERIENQTEKSPEVKEHAIA